MIGAESWLDSTTGLLNRAMLLWLPFVHCVRKAITEVEGGALHETIHISQRRVKLVRGVEKVD